MLQTFFHFGDECRYTGKTMVLHGGIFYEYEVLDGHRKGTIGVTQRAPVEVA